METPLIEKSNLEIEVLPNLEALNHRAASFFVSASKNSIDTKKRFAVAISGGFTPRGLYKLLSSVPYRGQVDWTHVHFFWADERCVPKDHEESNFGIAFDTLLSRISIPDGNIHRIRGEEDPEKSARDYEDNIKKFFGMSGIPMFDLIILGMGEDGHTASLFPGSKLLKETIRLAVPVYLPKPTWNRITLTFPILNNATQILFLVAGRSKASILSEILGDREKKKRFPAGLINPVHGYMTWLIDQEAAERLRGLKS